MKCENIALEYARNTLMENINIEIFPGDFVFLIGESGAGKTTFLRLISGNFRPGVGRVLDDEGGDIY